jgi:hypothetical protein
VICRCGRSILAAPRRDAAWRTEVIRRPNPSWPGATPQSERIGLSKSGSVPTKPGLSGNRARYRPSRRRAFCTDGKAAFALASGRARTSTLAGLAAIVISSPVAGLRPVRFLVAGLTRTVSWTTPALDRPLLTQYLRPSARAAAAPLTITWGVALLVIAAVQLAGAIIGLGSITSLGGLAARTGFALGAEAIVLGASAAYLARAYPVTAGGPAEPASE